MKILFFTASLSGGGAERVLANIANALVKQGHEVVVSINDNNIAYDLHEEVNIVIAPQLNINRGNNLFMRLRRRVKRHFRDNSHTRNIINTISPDVIVSFLHCNMRAIVKWHGNIPIIHSEHNAYDRKLGLKNYYERFYLNHRFDKVFVLSSFDMGFASAKGLTNAIYMPNPNTYEVMDESDYVSQFYQRKNILICGRVDAWHIKGFDLAIKAFAKISKRYPSLRLNIAGNGSPNSIESLRKIAEEYGIKDKVYFLGYSSNMRDVYRTHQVLLMSSRTEGFPMVVSEAMSQGLPCVSFERLSSSIIIDGVDGLLVNNQSVDEISSSLSYLLDEDTIRYELGLNAIRNIGRFAKENIASRWLKVFNELIIK